jgi:hypothetical protein
VNQICVALARIDGINLFQFPGKSLHTIADGAGTQILHESRHPSSPLKVRGQQDAQWRAHPNEDQAGGQPNNRIKCVRTRRVLSSIQLDRTQHYDRKGLRVEQGHHLSLILLDQTLDTLFEIVNNHLAPHCASALLQKQAHSLLLNPNAIALTIQKKGEVQELVLDPD